MKKNISILILITSVNSFLYSQSRVGINTSNPKGILHIDGQKDNLNPEAITATQASNDVIVDSEGRVGIGTINPAVKLDVRSAGNSAIGFGNTTLTAPAAGGGALKYNSSNPAAAPASPVEYSNGQGWFPLYESQPSVNKVIIIANKINNTVRLVSPAGTVSTTGLQNRQSNYLTSWTKIFESNSAATFNAGTGIFTAPRNGLYVATFTTNMAPLNINWSTDPGNPIQIESIWQLYDSTAGLAASNILSTVKCANTMSSRSVSNLDAGSNCTASFYMTNGQRLMPYIWFNLNNSDTANFLLNTTGGYNNLTIAEQ